MIEVLVTWPTTIEELPDSVLVPDEVAVNNERLFGWLVAKFDTKPLDYEWGDGPASSTGATHARQD